MTHLKKVLAVILILLTTLLVAASMGPTYVWYDYATVPESRFRTEFGDFQLTEAGLYDVVTLQAKTGPSAFVVKVLDKNGVPVEGIQVVFSWPDAPLLPECGGLGRGVVGPTNVNGDVGFGMGFGSYYWPPARGPHQAWICNDATVVDGIGMVGLTNHNHFDITLQESFSPITYTHWTYIPFSIKEK